MSTPLEFPNAGSVSRRTLYIFLAIALAAIVIGILHASSLWFVNDDCFVSFRYARNFVRGLGLVYNAEEKVEGYTNFLWTLIIALGMKLGSDPVPFSTTLGIVFHALTLTLYAYVSWRFRSFGQAQLLVIPVTTVALSLHRDFNAYATSGLETAMFTFLVSAAFATLILGTSRRAQVVAGLLLMVTMLTRPDGVIFLAASVVYLLLTGKEPAKDALRLMLPSLMIFLPYWLWRWNYYGFFFPNTFYAKSIDVPYWSHGFVYTWMYLETYYVFVLLPILGGFGVWFWGRRTSGQRFIKAVHDLLRSESNRVHPLMLASLFIICQVLFVLRIGGDFMFARFFIVVTPMLFFSMELLMNQLTTRFMNLALVLLILGGTAFRNDLFREQDKVGYVADEARYYATEHLLGSQVTAAVFRKYFDDLPVRIAFWAGQLKLAYYIDSPFALEASAGLTDTAIAHQLIAERGRPGHEKQAPFEYLLRRNVHFYIGPIEAPPSGQLPLNAVVFEYILARTIVYDNTIMSHLAEYPEVHFIRLPEYLDSYIAGMHTYRRDQVEQDYAYFKSFYFDHNNDRSREQAFVSFLQNNPDSSAAN